MTLQSSGAISLSDIAAEFGGSTPHSINEYYRGGGLVPDTPANSGIPTSGVISFSDFYDGDATVGGLDTTMTAGSAGIQQWWYTGTWNFDAWTVYGYDHGDPDGLWEDFTNGTTTTWIDDDDGFGTIDPIAAGTRVEFESGGNGTQVITCCYEAVGNVNGDNLYFGLDITGGPITTGPTDNDSTFVSIEVNGTTFTRATADIAAFDQNGARFWGWTNPDVITGTGVIDFVVNV